MKLLHIFPLLYSLVIQAELLVITPPEKWQLVNQQEASTFLEVAMVEPSINYPSSLSIAKEPLKVPESAFISAAKDLLSSNKTLRDLGKKRTPVGNATIFQTETSNHHGQFVSLIAILFTPKTAFTFTMACKKENLSRLYPLFDRALSSASIHENSLEIFPEAIRTTIQKKQQAITQEVSLLPEKKGDESIYTFCLREKKGQKILASFEKNLPDLTKEHNLLIHFYLLRDFVRSLKNAPFSETNK